MFCEKFKFNVLKYLNIKAEALKYARNGSVNGDILFDFNHLEIFL